MFETSRPQDPKRTRLFFLELLPVSLVFHGCILAAVILASIWNVTFPSQSPKMFMAFQLADSPPPPPPPPPPPAARPRSMVKPVVKPPEEIVAPTVVPDEIPVVENEAPPPEEEAAVEGGVEGGIAGGEIGGVVGGVEGSVVPPVPPPPPPPSDGRVHIARDEPLELTILSQPHPTYPSRAASQGWEDRVVVRYVIGKDGRVKDVKIIEPPTRKDFEEPTLRAIRMWRFRPFVQEGKRVEVVHELTVFYRLVAKGG
jgi:periplasmic protein TonB